MADLTQEMKEAIVKAHASFVTPPDIRTMMRDDFGVDVDLRQIHGYNPTKGCFDAGQTWREFFDAHRKTYMNEIASHDIASPAYRIGMLDRMAKKAEKAGNMKLAAELAEQAAKEVGGAFTNERKLTGAFEHRHRPATAEDARVELTERLKRIQQMAAKSGQDVTPSGQQGVDVANGS